MKHITKNLYIIGLALFILGETISIFKIVREALFFIPGGIRAEVNSAYITNSLLAHIIPIIIKLIIAFIIVFMITRILKNVKSKCLIPLFCCSIIFLIINLTSFFLPAIPKYLIYSKLGIIETYLVYFVNYLTNGTIFSMVAYIIILVASIQILRRKKKEAENDG